MKKVLEREKSKKEGREIKEVIQLSMTERNAQGSGIKRDPDET